MQEALPDLKAAGDGAVLVTNGAFGEINPMIDNIVIAMGVTGVALANAAKAKLVGLLSARLKDDGVYVGEVTIAGVVKGTAPKPPGFQPLKAQPSPMSFGGSTRGEAKSAPGSVDRVIHLIRPR